MTPLHVTFYSYKGGVGRTLALLNVAAELADAGCRVIAIDLDLEAPGFGLSALTRAPEMVPGVSDYFLLADLQPPLDGYTYCIRRERFEDRLRLMQTGYHTHALQRALIQTDPASPPAVDQFYRLLGQLADEFMPHFILIDSRTGLADIAALATVELNEVLVAVCGLSEQNIAGMTSVLRQLREHPNRPHSLNDQPIEQAQLLVLSPVPRYIELGRVRHDLDSSLEHVRERASTADVEERDNPLWHRLAAAERALLHPTLRHLRHIQDQGRYPLLRSEDAHHILDLDPAVPVLGELLLNDLPDTRLPVQYKRLALALTRAHARSQGDDRPPEVEAAEQQLEKASATLPPPPRLTPDDATS